MYSESSRYPDNLIFMVKKINDVGLKKIKKYVISNHKKVNFDRHVEILRHIAKYGYTSCIEEFSISKQRAEQILKKFYEYAVEIEEQKKEKPCQKN